MTIKGRILAISIAMVILITICLNSGIAIIAETNPLRADLFVHIPEGWTNTCDDWIEIPDDSTVYYKISNFEMPDSDWGDYTDPDAQVWDSDVILYDTDADGDYIKFWFVKNDVFTEEDNTDSYIIDDSVEPVDSTESYIDDDDFLADDSTDSYIFDDSFMYDESTESTVTDDAVLFVTDAIPFFFDTTKPDVLQLMKNEDVNPYTIDGNTKDTLSGICSIYYSIGEQYAEISEIEENCIKVESDNVDEDDIAFIVECTADMSNQRVYIYVIDNARNIQIDYIDVTSYMDTSAPSLTIEGIDEEAWVNTIEGWNVSTDSEEAKIFYRTSENDEKDWGTYADAIEWNADTMIPEGEHYIHFWAAYDDSRRDVAESETLLYKFDSTGPDSFSVESEHIPGHYDKTEQEYIPPRFIIKGSAIRDQFSGVDISSLKYEALQHNKVLRYGDVPKESVNSNTDGALSFTLDLSDANWLDDVNLVFYVSDMVGNMTSSILNQSIDETIHYDSHAPEIVKGENNIGITNGADSTVAVLTPFSFGSKKANAQWDSVYVNDKDHFIKVTINDNNLSRIIVYVDDSESGIEFSEDGSETQERKWVCEESQDSDTKVYFIKVSDLNFDANMNHYIKIVAFDGSNTSAPAGLSFNKEEEETEYTLFYDPKKEGDASISFETVGEKNNGYYGIDVESHIIKITVEDDNALSGFNVTINGNRVFESPDISNGEEVTEIESGEGDAQDSTSVESETYWMPVTTSIYTLTLDDKAIAFKNGSPVDGKYNIDVSAIDLAGNEFDDSYSFVVDTTPPVIDQCEYQYNQSLLRYQPFGLFGNEPLKISIIGYDPEVEPDVSGIGIQRVVLKWASKTYTGKYNSETYMYEFDSLPVGYEGVPELVIKDKLGNSATYYMVSADDSDNKATIQLSTKKVNIPLVLESVLPVSAIIPPENFAVSDNETDTLTIYKQIFEDGHVEWWYPSETAYQITAQDNDSGLYSVFVTENDGLRAEERNSGKTSFDDGAFVELSSYSYAVTEEGDYKLFTYAVDNARNNNLLNSKASQALTIHLDKTKPEITEFLFGGYSDQGDTAERTTYGTFFVEDTEVRVYIEDPGVSSGLNNVELYLSNVNGESETFTKVASEFNTDQEDGRIYASFVIGRGFKGKVTAVVTDNVGHSSGKINANGCIVEDSDLHSQTSSIEIKENETSVQKDANGLLLYNNSIPITVTVDDSFSGISRIDWSIANDNEAGTIEVDIDGNWRNVSGDAQILEDSIERDQNLITKLPFSIIIDSNTNGNAVHVTLTDRSGNTSESDTSYSIDTTVPVISASMDGGSALNDFYYNTDQTVTVSITERNFNPSDVDVKVNNNTWAVQWNDQAPSITTDETVHIGTFTISTDGEYEFSINYTDMAGNMGTSHVQSRFVVDKTSPKISNNFESFGLIGDENIYYNSLQKDDAEAEIRVVETNFTPSDMNVEVYYKPAGSSHAGDGEGWSEYYYSADWKDDGSDIHNLRIPFAEEGVYKVEMAPIDRAGNVGDFTEGANSQYPSETAVFETDYTDPIVVARNDRAVKSDDVEFYDVYDFDRRDEAAPNVVFEDINIDHISCEGQKYTPSYTNGREIGEIKPVYISSESNKLVSDTYIPQMVFTLGGFATDGVYSVKLTAYDKAGNKSVLNNSTYVRMVDPTINVLAFIENSDREKMEGWYSFEDDKGPISKRPDSFSDLKIVVLSKASGTRIKLVDKATNSSTDTNITDSEDALFDDGMYQIGAYRYTLPGEYFEKNYTADTDTNLYLKVENNGDTIDLGEIYIDNTDPECDIPKEFRNWGWFKGDGNQVLKFKNVSEALDTNETVAYIDGQMVHLSIVNDRELSEFKYDEQNSVLSLTLEPGSHNVGLLLVDRAGNKKYISEVRHLAIGNNRIWIGAGISIGIFLMAVISVYVVKKAGKSMFT